MKTTSKLSLGITWRLVLVAVVLTGTALAQYTPSILYTFFTGVHALPSGVIMDSAGNLYGTTRDLGSCGNQESCGTVFELSPKSGGGWTETTIYSSNIAAGTLGSPLTMDAAGNLYGVMSAGGNTAPKYCFPSCGMVFELSPGTGGWTFTEIFGFHGSDGANPVGGLVFDSAGNLYGNTFEGGTPGLGTVYRLTPTSGGWQHKVLHFFTGGIDGSTPDSGLAIDAAGNLYGAAAGGLNGLGVVFKLTAGSGGTYHFKYIHSFTGGAKGQGPHGPLLLDAAGDIFGETVSGGSTKTICNLNVSPGCGVVYELLKTGSGYTEKILHNFVANVDGQSPVGGLIADSSGNLYGTTVSGIDGKVIKIFGTVFKLTPTTFGWTETTLLTGTRTFGTFEGGVILDSAGNLYGPAQGSLIFELSPPAP